MCAFRPIIRFKSTVMYSWAAILVLFLTFSCADDSTQDLDDPANLEVHATVATDGSGEVDIVASADNVVEYQLRVAPDTIPIEINTTGTFTHTFERTGIYRMEVRAYGRSGRFLRETIEVLVEIPDQIVTPEDGYTTPLIYDGYRLVWHDEFDGNVINPDYWVFETGTGCPHLCGWGNNELQYYRQRNAWISDGILTIEARQEPYQGSNYTSARMKTQGNKSFQYGRIDIRALLPEGQGIWPALWMLGNDITTVGWPKCGEIDIMEMIGGRGRENQVHGTLHWDLNGHVHSGGMYTLPSGTFADEYHVFSIIWDQTNIRWFVNDVQFYVIDITPNHMTEFHQEFFFIFNVAVGGRWPGNPDATTVFPQQMKVDYVRVFQKI